MGALIDVVSGPLHIRRDDFPLVLAGLRRLADERPGEFENVAGVLAAADPAEALDAGGWAVAVDRAGDIVGIAADDKAPSRSDPSWPYWVLDALAVAVREPAEVYVHREDDEEDEETVYRVAPSGVTWSRRVRTGRHKWPPVDSVAPPADLVYRPLPDGSFGLQWRVAFRHPEHEWFRHRERVRAVVEALAGTAWWAEFALLRGDRFAIPADGGPLDPGGIAGRVADGRMAGWVLTGSGGEVRVGLEITPFGLNLTARARDGALDRLGPAAIDGMLAAVRDVMTAHREDCTVTGYAVPVGTHAYQRIRRG